MLDTYGEKALVEVEGRPFFGELAILCLLKKSGWDGVWIDTFSRGAFRRARRDEAKPVSLPPSRQLLYDKIVHHNGGRIRGCWDLLAWQGPHSLFVEAKRRGRDKLRPTQHQWLHAAHRAGLTADAFAVVEWDIAAH